jgi:hypothetical protein
MSALESIERAIKYLSPAELAQFRQWFAQFDTMAHPAGLPEAADEPSTAEFEAGADQLAEDLARFLGTQASPLSDYAVSRAGIYEDHP